MCSRWPPSSSVPFLEAHHEAVDDSLAYRPKNGSHSPWWLPWDQWWSRASLSTRGSKFSRGLWNLHVRTCASRNARSWMVIILSTLLQSTRKQVDPYHALALYVEYDKLVVSQFSLYLKRNIVNDTHLKSGPLFIRSPGMRLLFLCPSLSRCKTTLPPFFSFFLYFATFSSRYHVALRKESFLIFCIYFEAVVHCN